MGKNRHSKDRLFITQTEHKYLYGGKKAEVRRAYRRTILLSLSRVSCGSLCIYRAHLPA